VLAHGLDHPCHGALRVEQELRLKGLAVSSSGIRGATGSGTILLIKHERLLRLEKETSQRVIELSEEQTRLLERFSPEFRERLIEAPHTGSLVAVEVHDHNLHADPRDDLPAPAGAGPVLCHADPAGAGVGAIFLGLAVLPFGEAKQDLKVLQAVMRPEVEPQLDAAISSGWISSPSGPATSAICVPSMRGRGVVRCGVAGTLLGMAVKALLYSGSHALVS
jgi:hypothetical protein